MKPSGYETRWLIVLIALTLVFSAADLYLARRDSVRLTLVSPPHAR